MILWYDLPPTSSTCSAGGLFLPGFQNFFWESIASKGQYNKGLCLENHIKIRQVFVLQKHNAEEHSISWGKKIKKERKRGQGVTEGPSWQDWKGTTQLLAQRHTEETRAH